MLMRMVLPILLGVCLPAAAQLLTSQNDNARTSANLHETTLTPANVNPQQFGKVFTLRVDGDVYAQPLYVAGVTIPGKGQHNVLFVATEHDSVYAFDADGNDREPLWHVSFLAPGVTTLSAREDARCPFIQPEIGITPTPVIDLPTGTLYVLARTKERGRYVQRLRALAITTGAEKFGGPREITGDGFNPLRELPRAGLLLNKGLVYLTWASSCDVETYHGWVMAYDAHTLAQTAVFNTSPSGDDSGIWQADNAPAADGDGNVYVATGNGTFTPGRDWGDTLLKLALDSHRLAVRDSFTPSNQRQMAERDLDFGSGGPMLTPGGLVVIGGKDGRLYALERDPLGANPQEVFQFRGGIYSAPAYWNGHVYMLASDDYVSDFAVQKGHLMNRPSVVGEHRFGNPGATPAISANGTRDGIVWLIETKKWNEYGDRPAVLHAYEAANVAHELYHSAQNGSRDGAGSTLRFTIPSVVNGRVYVEAKREIDVYGLVMRK